MDDGARIVLLGGPAVVLGDGSGSTRAPARRQSSLALGYLCLERGRPVPADELAEACWPTGPPRSWPASLRRAVSDLREWVAAAPGVTVSSVHGAYRLDLPASVVLDVDAAEIDLRAAESGDLAAGRRALEALQRPLLPGLDAPWLDARRAASERLAVRAAELVSEAERAQGDADAALEAAEAAVALDPLRESAHRLVMAAHRAAGRFGPALRAYERCRSVLADELGVAPSPATVAAYQALLAAPVGDDPPFEDPEPADLAGSARAMAVQASREAVAALEARLAAVDLDPHPDPRKRAGVLVDLGRARWALDGATHQVVRAGLAAGEAALHVGAAEHLDGALQLLSTTTGVGRWLADADDLAARALEAATRPASRSRALALQAELREGDAAVRLAAQAVSEARAAGDGSVLLDALMTYEQAVAWTPDLAGRLAVGAECRALVASGVPQWRQRPTFEALTRLQGGDRAALAAEGERMAALAEVTRQWEPAFYATAYAGVTALLTGDLEAADALATALVGQGREEANGAHAAAGLYLAVARERGGVADLLPALDAIVVANPAITAFRSAQALGRAVAGDRSAAVAALDALVADGIGAAHRDHVWPLHLGLVAEAAALVEHRAAAEQALPLLEPYAGLLCAGAHGCVALSSFDTGRGQLLHVLGRPDEAVAALHAGLELERRLDAPLLAARTEAWLARAGAGALHAAAALESAAVPGRDGLRDAIDQVLGGSR